jgi:hypothetical protein
MSVFWAGENLDHFPWVTNTILKPQVLSDGVASTYRMHPKNRALTTDTAIDADLRLGVQPTIP